MEDHIQINVGPTVQSRSHPFMIGQVKWKGDKRKRHLPSNIHEIFTHEPSNASLKVSESHSSTRKVVMFSEEQMDVSAVSIQMIPTILDLA